MKKTVQKRQVFYIPGYDPMLPRRYRELYRNEGKKQAEISGYELTLTGRKTGAGHYGWAVSSLIDGRKTQTDFTFLLWSDIVRTSMERSIPGTFMLLVKVAWIYINTGALRALMKLQKGPIVAALYPVVILIGELILGLLLALLGYWALAALGYTMIGMTIFAAILCSVMIWFKKKDGKIFAYYLLHDYAFSATYYGANPPALEKRLAEFGADISAALASDVDEVLVVGHSSGAHLAVSILADILREKPLGASKNLPGPKLSFLSLGQVVPMVSFLPKAGRLRSDLNFLCQRSDITWIDVTAPGDGCSFALCDPVMVSGSAPSPGKKLWPLVFSAAYKQSLSAEFLHSMRWRFFRLHFQYLCAFDRPKDYDYFQITAGPVALNDRYVDRLPSPSRIETALSPYQDLSDGQCSVAKTDAHS